MDFTSIIGILVGVVLIVFGILQGGVLSSFYDFPSILITIGGTLASTIIAFPIDTFKNVPKHMKIIIKRKTFIPDQYIEKIVGFAETARRKGLLSLENEVAQVEDKFLADATMLIVDAIDSEKVREMLDNELSALEDRHSRGWEFYEKAASFAPAFGMIGTLIGLVIMLANMDLEAEGGSEKLAGGMATALLTTLYGTLIANLLLIPLAHKLHMRHNEEMICKEIVTEGIMAILAGENPRHIEMRLKAFVATNEREKQAKAEKVKKPKKGEVEPEEA